MSGQDQAAAAAAADDVVRAELDRVMGELKAAGVAMGLAPDEALMCIAVQAELDAAAERIDRGVGPEAGGRAAERLKRKDGAA